MVEIMDTKYSHLVQVGEIDEKTILYFEDYAYTFLKKNEEKSIFYLYGEVKKEEEKKKIYIYGIAHNIKQEKDYFNAYSLVGTLKIKEEKFYWSDTKKIEEEVKGYYIFYATNQAMQEFLIDHNTEEKEEILTSKKQKRQKSEEINIREVLLSKPIIPVNKRKMSAIYLLIPILAAVMIFTGLLPENAAKKIEVFKEIIEDVSVKDEEEFMTISIEEVSVNENRIIEETKNIQEQTIEEEEQIGEIEEVERITEKEETEDITEEEKEQTVLSEYIVQEGDTLARICKKFYGDTIRIKEICEVNEIENEDYIAPGQKLYLPN